MNSLIGYWEIYKESFELKKAMISFAEKNDCYGVVYGRDYISLRCEAGSVNLADFRFVEKHDDCNEYILKTGSFNDFRLKLFVDRKDIKKKNHDFSDDKIQKEIERDKTIENFKNIIKYMLDTL